MKPPRSWMSRLLPGALLGALLAPAVVYFISPMWITVQENAAQTVGSLWATDRIPLPVTPAMAEAFGSLPLALTVQSLLGGLFGAVCALATLPFAEGGRELVLRSLAHFAATALTFSLLLGVCRWVDRPAFILLWVFLLAVLYLLVWLGRWIGWYLQVMQIRSLLGLDPGPSPLKWRETLPYLPFQLLVFLLLPAVLIFLDRTVILDVPVLSQLIWPFLFLPVSGFLSGFSLGRRQGICLLYPLTGALLALPASLLILQKPVPLWCVLAALSALSGNLLGRLFRRPLRGKP